MNAFQRKIVNILHEATELFAHRSHYYLTYDMDNGELGWSSHKLDMVNIASVYISQTDNCPTITTIENIILAYKFDYEIGFRMDCGYKVK